MKPFIIVLLLKRSHPHPSDIHKEKRAGCASAATAALIIFFETEVMLDLVVLPPSQKGRADALLLVDFPFFDGSAPLALGSSQQAACLRAFVCAQTS